MPLSDEQITLYRALIKGREDVYARYWEKEGKSGFSPAYKINWDEYNAFKNTGGSFKDFTNKTTLPLTNEVIESHLLGTQQLGIYPLLADNTSYFVVADFDKEHWKDESRECIKVCTELGIPCYLEISRSGNGGHLWIFFKYKYPAVRSRAIFLEILRKSLHISVLEKEVSFDRLFPSQDFHTKLGFGNLIVLPLHGKSLTTGKTCFIDKNTFEVIENQWEYLASIERLLPDKLDKLFNELVCKEALTNLSNNASSSSETSNVLRITINSQIVLNRVEISPALMFFLRDNLNFPNSEYIIKKKIGMSTYKIEQYFKTVSEVDDKILIPRGFYEELLAFCIENDIPHVVIDKRKLRHSVKVKSLISLYPHQQELLGEIEKEKSGIIVSPPGSGKTIIGLELIARKKQPSLIIVHRKQLFDQWIERIESFLGIPKKQIGKISGSKKKIGEVVTIAMMQTLVKMATIEELKDTFGLILVEECHHIPSKTFRETIVKFNPYYLYGLTATPKRKYNDEKLIYVYIGGIIANLENKQTINQPEIHVRIRETNIQIPFDSKLDDLQMLSKILTYDCSRNKLIADDITEVLKENKKILVLTERRQHVEILNQYLKNSFEVVAVTGEDSVSQRNFKIKQIQDGHYQIIISTGQFFGEGVDIDSLDCLFLVYPFSFEGKLKQYIGRIQRNNNNQLIFDYRDKNIAYCEKLFKKRNAYYNKIKTSSNQLNIIF